MAVVHALMMTLKLGEEKQIVSDSFEEASPDNKSNQQLEQLAKEARQYPPNSPQRQIALNRLVNGILDSDRLGHPQKGLWPFNLYEDIYNEALQKTLLKVCQEIDHYNPDHPVMAWTNFYLKNQFIDVVNDYKKVGITYIPSSRREQITCIASLDDLDRYIPVEEALSDDQLLRQFLEDDPENLFQAERLREYPSMTFQFLAMALLEGQTYTEISNNLGISIQTLSSFMNRRLQKLMPYFRKYLHAR